MVTGAARGIGASIGDALLREGGNVVYADLDDQITTIAGKGEDRARAQAGRAVGVKLDVTDRKQVRAGIERAVSEFGALHVMFNNAGINKPMNFLDVTEATISPSTASRLESWRRRSGNSSTKI